MLLFTFNLSAYSANAMVRQNTKSKVWLCYEYDYARHIDYGLYLDDYDMSVIDYNTVTM